MNMHPNGRTIRRRLMQGRAQNFWGQRASITVRLPLSVVPEPYPDVSLFADWGEEVVGGFWVKSLPEGREELRRISQVTSGALHPEDIDQAYFIQAESHGCSWWEGFSAVVAVDREGPVEWVCLPEETVGAYRVVSRWHEAYVYGLLDVDRGPVLEAFIRAGNAAKTHGAEVSADRRFVYVTYSVKWKHPRRVLRFCRGLKAAFRIAARHGVEAGLA